MEVQQREVEYYLLPNGKSPFLEWYYSLRNEKAQAIILKRLARVRMGNLGEYHSMGDRVFEFKIDFGPGYRLYFGQQGSQIILLCGGDKNDQQKDIKKAKEYWNDYERK